MNSANKLHHNDNCYDKIIINKISTPTTATRKLYLHEICS